MTQGDFSHLRALFDLADSLSGAERAIGLGPAHDRSQLAEDDQGLAGYYLSHAAQRSIGSAADHALTLHCVIESGVIPVFGPWTLVRGILERAATAVWLLAPRQQVRRREHALRYWHDNAEERKKWASDSGAPPATNDVGAKLRAFAEELGIRPQAVNAGLNWTDVLRSAGDDTPGQSGNAAVARWRECSAFAHGMAWPSVDLVEVYAATPIPGGLELAVRLDDDRFELATSTATAALHRALDLYATAAGDRPGRAHEG